jgi:cell division protein FtsZ
MLEFDDEEVGPGRPTIKVIGVGGGGGNSINTMIEAGVEGVDFIVANTDCQVLEANQAGIKVHLGKALTKGLGAGANPEIGRAAALEDASRVAEALSGADMVFVTAGMGGGTGTGAAPVIAQVARDMGALTVGVVTKPFAFEGSQRKKKAMSGISELAKSVDALIVIPNDRLIALAGVKMSLKDAFAMVDNVCVNAVRGISDLVIMPGLINVDFADVRTVMTGMGRALMGSGRGHGEKRAIEAAQHAINSPLLEDVSINGATGILINITGGPDLTLAEVNDACSLIEEAADPDANIIFGSVIDPNAGDEMRITVIATGFQPRSQSEQAVPAGRPVAHGSVGRRGTDQMALPMQAQTMAQAQYPGMSTASTMAMPAQMGTQQWGNQPPVPATRGYAAAGAPPRGVEALAEPIDLDDFYLGPDPQMGQAPSPISPMPLSPSAPMYTATGMAPASAAEWGDRMGDRSGERPGDRMADRPGDRPIIRPPVSGPTGQPQRRAQVPRAADELGVEESEFDKPTYLRRGLVAPE